MHFTKSALNLPDKVGRKKEFGSKSDHQVHMCSASLQKIFVREMRNGEWPCHQSKKRRFSDYLRKGGPKKEER